MQKDELVNRALRNMGYTVFPFWSQDIPEKPTEGDQPD
jgi:DNA mismatch endonuclease (patch repair protein)